MIGDKLFEFSSAQAITAASAFSTYDQDLGSVFKDFGPGTQLYVVVNVVEAFVVNASTPSLICHISLDIDPTHSGILATFLGSSVSYLAAGLTLGQTIVIPLMQITKAQKAAFDTAAGLGFPYRYLGMFYELDGGTFSAGKVTTFLTTDPTSFIQGKNYADAV